MSELLPLRDLYQCYDRPAAALDDVRQTRNSQGGFLSRFPCNGRRSRRGCNCWQWRWRRASFDGGATRGSSANHRVLGRTLTPAFHEGRTPSYRSSHEIGNTARSCRPTIFLSVQREPYLVRSKYSSTFFVVRLEPLQLSSRARVHWLRLKRPHLSASSSWMNSPANPGSYQSETALQ